MPGIRTLTAVYGGGTNQFIGSSIPGFRTGRRDAQGRLLDDWNAFDQAEADFQRGEAEGDRIRGFQNRAFSGGMDLLDGLSGNVNDIGGYQADFRQQGLDFTRQFEADRAEAFSQQRGDEESLIAGGMRGMASNRERMLADIANNPELTEGQRMQLQMAVRQDMGAQQNQFVTQAREAGRQQRQGMFSDWGQRRLGSQTMASGALQNAMGSAATAGGLRGQGASAYGALGSSMQTVPVTSLLDTQAGFMSVNNMTKGRLIGFSGKNSYTRSSRLRGAGHR